MLNESISCCSTEVGAQRIADEPHRAQIENSNHGPKAVSEPHNKSLPNRMSSKDMSAWCCESGFNSRKTSRSHALSPDARESQNKSTQQEPVNPSSMFPIPGVNREHESSDIEKNAARTHVCMNIAGMTCSGCARKVTGVLSKLAGVSNVTINFVASQGEFSLDQNIATATEILTKLEHKTGFRCTLLQHDLQTLNVVLSSDAASKLLASLPAGIESVERLDKIYRISFDPTVIGARSVLQLTGATELGPPESESISTLGMKRLLSTFTSFVLAATFTIPVIVLEWSSNPLSYSKRSVAVILLASAVQAVAIPEFYAGALKSLIYSHVIEMDMLVVISITAAYVYSVVMFGLTHAGYILEQGEIFETSTLLITLVLLGRVVSAYTKHRAIIAVSLKSLQVEKAIILTSMGESREIDARLLEYGDEIQVLPYSTVVTDGEIINGSSSADESMLTGESIPVTKTIGDGVLAGTINKEGILTIRLSRLPGQNSITDIANLVENALAAKPRIQDLADKVASYFVPAVVSISTLVFIIWMVVSIELQGMSAGAAIGTAITYSIAVLAISCPCALGLAVPMVLVIAGGLGAKSGIIIKKADVTEGSHKVTDVIFDKTGTLTYDILDVQTSEIFSTAKTASTISGLVLGLVKTSQHPVSAAVAQKLSTDGVRTTLLDSVHSVPGKGIEGVWNNQKIRGGNADWLNLSANPIIQQKINEGATIFCVTIDDELVAVFSLMATIRKEAVFIISELERRGIQTHIVSGDNAVAVEDVALMLGIPMANVLSKCSPTAKHAYVKTLMDEGKYVLFCGDGTNDAIAVAQANVGVQIGDTSDVTKATADVVLLGGLEGIVKLLDVSKRSFRRIVFNFLWSAIYNIFAILFAGGAFVKIRIPPAYAGLGEIVSVLPIVIAALSIMWF